MVSFVGTQTIASEWKVRTNVQNRVTRAPSGMQGKELHEQKREFVNEFRNITAQIRFSDSTVLSCEHLGFGVGEEA
jgi:hypothetical protein